MSSQQTNHEPLFHSIAYQSDNMSQAPNDTNSVLLIHRHAMDIDSNNDASKPQKPNVRRQQFSFNINDKCSRLRLWAIIILIVSIAEINFTLSLRLYYDTYKQQFNEQSDPNPYIGTKLYDILSLISNSLLFAGASFILLGVTKQRIIKILTSILFVIGAAVHLFHCVYGIHLYCIDDPNDTKINNKNTFCRLSFIGSDLYLQAFLLFYATDIIKGYGDKIRTRVFVQSVLLTAVGFINAGNAFHDDSEFKKDSALIYASTIVASGYLVIALIAVSIFSLFCLVTISYILLMAEADDGYECNSCFLMRRLIGFALLIGTGMVMTSPYIYIFVTGSVDEIGTPNIHSLLYFIVGTLLFVYDLQYIR